MWRDSHTLLQEGDGRSKVIDWAARINSLCDNSIRSKYALEAVGIATASGKAASVIFWRHERLPLPLAYLEKENTGLAHSLSTVLELTETTAKNLNGAIRNMAEGMLPPKSGRENKRAVQDLVDHLGADRAYWSRLEGPFKRLLVELPDDVDDDGEYGGNRISEWKKLLRDTLRGRL